MIERLPFPFRFAAVGCASATTMAAVAAACLTAGCTLGPDFQRPSLEGRLPESFDVPDGWKVAEPDDAAPLGDWWVRFGDGRLDELVSGAMVENQDLAAAFHRVEQARALSRGARGAWFPTIDFDPSARRSRRSGTARSGASDLAGSTNTNLLLPLLLDYEVDLWGRLRRALEAADAETLAEEALLRQVRLTIQAEIASQYFGLRAFDADIGIFERAVVLRRKALDLNRRRFEAGDTDEVDVSRAATELASAEAELIGLRQNRAQLENALAVLVGRPSSGFGIPEAPLDGDPPPVPVTLPAELLERRPDIAAAERAVMAANARIGVAETAFFPAVRFSAGSGLESSDAALLFDSASRIWSLGPQVSLPIFDGGRRRAGLERAEARYDEVVARYRQTVLQAVREVDDALVALARLAERAAAQERTVAAARRTVELSSRRYEAGVVAYFEVVDAQRTELDAEEEAIRLRAARHVATVALVRALGGDWR